ncbi:hypothetical protein BK011_09200 [Tenericutes bacterium MZ-XQ]|jgi:hypothetical protein|nr:hypothetical protein BK011_09200 [Tenericutes bacterium MZ-XQ]
MPYMLISADIIRFSLFIFLSFLISLPMSWLLSQISQKLIFLIPTLFAILGILLMIMGLLAESFGPIVFFVMGMFSFLIFVGTMASSVVIKITRKAPENKPE